MVRNPASEAVRAAAELISLPLEENEIEPLTERLSTLLEACSQIRHLTENNAELDLRFDANWEKNS